MRLAMLALSAVVLVWSAGPVLASDLGKPPVYVEAYVDEAPAGTEVIEKVRVTRDGRDRVLVIVTAQPGNAAHPGVAFDESAEELPLQLRGQSAEVAKIMDAEEGAALKGTFKFYPGSRALLLQDLGS